MQSLFSFDYINKDLFVFLLFILIAKTLESIKSDVAENSSNLVEQVECFPGNVPA